MDERLRAGLGPCEPDETAAGETVLTVSRSAEVAHERSLLLKAAAAMMVDAFGAAKGEDPLQTIVDLRGRSVRATHSVVVDLYVELNRMAEDEQQKAHAMMATPVPPIAPAPARGPRAVRDRRQPLR
jgi:hypothetical protein